MGAGQPLAGRHAALPAPLTQRRRSNAQRRRPRLRRRELHAARAATRSRWTRCGTATAHPLPPFEHQPADAQATATHRARAAPPQEPARAQQRPRSTPSRSSTSPRGCRAPARGRRRRRASPPTATRARFDAARPPYTAKVARVVRVRVGRLSVVRRSPYVCQQACGSMCVVVRVLEMLT